MASTQFDHHIREVLQWTPNECKAFLVKKKMADKSILDLAIQIAVTTANKSEQSRTIQEDAERRVKCILIKSHPAETGEEFNGVIHTIAKRFFAIEEESYRKVDWTAQLTRSPPPEDTQGSASHGNFFTRKLTWIANKTKAST